MSVRKSAGAGNSMSYMQDVMRHLWRLLYDRYCLLSSSLFVRISHLRDSRSPVVNNRLFDDGSVGMSQHCDADSVHTLVLWPIARLRTDLARHKSAFNGRPFVFFGCPS